VYDCMTYIYIYHKPINIYYILLLLLLLLLYYSHEIGRRGDGIAASRKDTRVGIRTHTHKAIIIGS